MRRRFALAFGFGAAALTAAVAGCSLLVTFNEVRVDASTSEAEAEAEASIGRDAEVESEAMAADTGPPPFPPPCDEGFPRDQVDCSGATRPNCAKRTALFASYPAGKDRANDSVTCEGRAVPTCVQHCPFGCALMPIGFPDQCDDCNGRADGHYCGRDLRDWLPANFDMAVECQGGKAIRGAACGTKKCASECPRADGPRPSCCIP